MFADIIEAMNDTRQDAQYEARVPTEKGVDGSGRLRQYGVIPTER